MYACWLDIISALYCVLSTPDPAANKGEMVSFTCLNGLLRWGVCAGINSRNVWLHNRLLGRVASQLFCLSVYRCGCSPETSKLLSLLGNTVARTRLSDSAWQQSRPFKVFVCYSSVLLAGRLVQLVSELVNRITLQCSQRNCSPRLQVDIHT